MTTTSKEYAEALFELAAGEQALEETSDGLVTVLSALRQAGHQLIIRWPR